MYVEKWLFWAVVVIIFICIVAYRAELNKKIHNVEQSGRNRSYNLYISLHPQEIKEILSGKGLAGKLIHKNCAAYMMYLGSDCKWFVRGNLVTIDVTKNTKLFYEQIAGKKGDELHEWSGAGAAFGITERFDERKGMWLSLDLFYKEYGEKGLFAKDEQRIHLGDFPIPKPYDEWDDIALDKIQKWGWAENNRGDWLEYTDDFGECQTMLDPTYYKNDFVTIEVC